MKRREQPLPVPGTGADAEPPVELWRFTPAQPPPIGPSGRPEPWAVKWEPAEFAEFLRARADWRATHTKPLPGLFALERCALRAMAERGQIPRSLAQAEQASNRGAPTPPYRPAARFTAGSSQLEESNR